MYIHIVCDTSYYTNTAIIYLPIKVQCSEYLARYCASEKQGQNLLQGTMGAPTQAQLDSYMNPFQQQVIDATMSELDKRGQMQANQLAGDAVRGGVFGGSRYGIQQAELSGQQQDARAAALAGLNSQNFGQAQAGVANQMERQRLAGLGIAGLGQQQSQ